LRPNLGRGFHKSVTISLSHFTVTLSSSVWGRMGLYGLGSGARYRVRTCDPYRVKIRYSLGNVTLCCNTGVAL
jgi:hypothetical protein